MRPLSPDSERSGVAGSLLDLVPPGLGSPKPIFALSARGLERRSHEAISYRIGRRGCGGFSAKRDVNGILWERVTADQGPENGGSSECPLSACAIP